MSTSCTDFLSLFVPCEYPTAFAASDSAVRDANDLANVRNAHRLQRLAFGIADIIERMALCHKKVAAPASQFAHATARHTTVLKSFWISDDPQVFWEGEYYAQVKDRKLRPE